MNAFLHEASVSLERWLAKYLPHVADSWWEDCVMASLSYSQREIAVSRGFSKLSEFDLAALLRITDKSWYDLKTVLYLSSGEREVIREMMTVRNNWAHCGTEILGKDIIISNLHTISALISQVGGSLTISDSINQFISAVEKPGSIQSETEQKKADVLAHTESKSSKESEIGVNSLVYVVGDPDKKGIVVSIENIGKTQKFNVFTDNRIRSFYTGQIALVEETKGYNWVSLNDVLCSLTAYQINNPSSQNLYSLNSARIDFVPYQFRPALKLIHSDEPRILIADSVGVGKTIEAGLIIKELEARNDLQRVVVICPRPLVAERKWELEMKRFDEEFIPVDGSTLRQILSDTDRDGAWPSRFSKVIIPYSILDAKTYNGDAIGRVRSFGLTELSVEPHFDLVIVDEAHHIRNGSMEKEKAFAYKCTKYFCDHADAVVMLTATPLQTSDTDLFTILNVLRPDIVIDEQTFEVMSRPNAFIARAAHSVRLAEPGWTKQAAAELRDVRRTQWGDIVISENPLYEEILARLENEDMTREERVKLISDIESLHSFNTMLNRTRRRDIQDFCVRRSTTISTEFTEYQRELHDELLRFEQRALSELHNTRSVSFMMSTIKRQAASCIFGLAPHIKDIIQRRIQQFYDDPDFDIDNYDCLGDGVISVYAGKLMQLAENLPDEDPKFDEVLKVIKRKQNEANNKIMLFSTFRHTLTYLKKKLIDSGYRVEQIDGSVKDEVRYALKERFELDKEDTNAIDILLFTEVGSEGLDYQFCNMMINYDLPWNPMRIEQRIGRIDRRGQISDAVNIYNVITENTVDADIYHRCLERIGVFERNIGDCEEILGEIAVNIESIITNNQLTDEERNKKLEQMADNEIRKIQEMNRLEEEEKELFGFDLTEFSTSQEIRKAENPWIAQKYLQRLVERYLTERIGTGVYITGDKLLKNLKLSATARGILHEDLLSLPGSRTALKRQWDDFLRGKKPNHAITFDSDTASKNRDCFFITIMHPLVRQAARQFEAGETQYMKLRANALDVGAGSYPFKIYAWQYSGLNPFTKLVTICTDERLATELTDIIDVAVDAPVGKEENYDWDALENKHAEMWEEAREKYLKDIKSVMVYKIESLDNNRRNRVRALERVINDTVDGSIKRMRESELETVKENYKLKEKIIREKVNKADIYSTLLVNGVLVVTGD